MSFKIGNEAISQLLTMLGQQMQQGKSCGHESKSSFNNSMNQCGHGGRSERREERCDHNKGGHQTSRHQESRREERCEHKEARREERREERCEHKGHNQQQETRRNDHCEKKEAPRHQESRREERCDHNNRGGNNHAPSRGGNDCGPSRGGNDHGPSRGGNDHRPSQSGKDCGPNHGGGWNNGGAHGGQGGGRTKDDVWTVGEIKDGKGEIKLGDRYTLSLDEHLSKWTVTDKNGGGVKVWADPNVDLNNDGSRDFVFNKNSTFQLDDGTKITVGVTPGGGETYSSTLAITKGNNAINVTGLADRFDGANNLQVTQSKNGRQVDRQTDDGAFTIKKSGTNWTIDGQAATQAIVTQKEAAKV